MSNITRKRKFGFLRRMSTKKGQQTINHRRNRGRKVLSA